MAEIERKSMDWATACQAVVYPTIADNYFAPNTDPQEGT